MHDEFRAVLLRTSKNKHTTRLSLQSGQSRKWTEYIPALNKIRPDLLVQVPSGNIMICNRHKSLFISCLNLFSLLIYHL